MMNPRLVAFENLLNRLLHDPSNDHLRREVLQAYNGLADLYDRAKVCVHSDCPTHGDRQVKEKQVAKK